MKTTFAGSSGGAEGSDIVGVIGGILVSRSVIEVTRPSSRFASAICTLMLPELGKPASQMMGRVSVMAVGGVGTRTIDGDWLTATYDGAISAIVARKAHWRGLGMDLENLLESARAERLAGEILTPPELQRMAAGDREHLALLVTLTFSVKESLFKALYPIVQQRFYFEHAEVVEWTMAGEVRLRLLTDLSSEWHNGVELDAQFAVKDDQLLSLVSIPA